MGQGHVDICSFMDWKTVDREVWDTFGDPYRFTYASTMFIISLWIKDFYTIGAECVAPVLVGPISFVENSTGLPFAIGPKMMGHGGYKDLPL